MKDNLKMKIRMRIRKNLIEIAKAKVQIAEIDYCEYSPYLIHLNLLSYNFV